MLIFVLEAVSIIRNIYCLVFQQQKCAAVRQRETERDSWSFAGVPSVNSHFTSWQVINQIWPLDPCDVTRTNGQLLPRKPPQHNTQPEREREINSAVIFSHHICVCLFELCHWSQWWSHKHHKLVMKLFFMSLMWTWHNDCVMCLECVDDVFWWRSLTV